MAGGRPTRYNAAYAKQAEVACREGGFTDKKLAKLFSVSVATISAWKKSQPEFLESLKRGKDDFDVFTAENCLLKRIKGYRYTEITKESVTDKVTKQTTLEVTKVVTKSVAPDVTAQIFFLKNRNPTRWRDTKNMELSGPDGKPIETKWVVEVVGVDEKKQ